MLLFRSRPVKSGQEPSATFPSKDNTTRVKPLRNGDVPPLECTQILWQQ
jgi:hypothetical protein